MARLLSRLGAFSHRHRLRRRPRLAGSSWSAAASAPPPWPARRPTPSPSPARSRRPRWTGSSEEFGAGGGDAAPGSSSRRRTGQTLTSPAERRRASGTWSPSWAGCPASSRPATRWTRRRPAVERRPDHRLQHRHLRRGAPARSPPTQQDALLAAVDDARDTGLTVEVDRRGASQEAAARRRHRPRSLGVVVALRGPGPHLRLAGRWPGMNLLTAVVGVGIGVLGITIATGFIDLSSTTPTLAAMLGLAVGIDYAPVHRHPVPAGAAPRRATSATAIATAVGTAGSAVVTAGLTVVIALVGLSVVGIPFLTQMGIAAAAHHRRRRPGRAHPGAGGAQPPRAGARCPRRQRGRARPATQPTPPPRPRLPRRLGRHGHPAPGAVAAAGRRRPRRRRRPVLLDADHAGADPAPRTAPRPGPSSCSPTASAPGFNGPLTVLFEGAGAAEAAARGRRADRRPGRRRRWSPRRSRTPTARAALLTVIPRVRADQRGHRAAGGRPARPSWPASTAWTPTSPAPPRSASTSPRALDEALPVYLALVVGLALVLLVLVFRSLLVPLVGVLGFLLTIGASLGATVAVFQWGWLADAGQPATAPDR